MMTWERMYRLRLRAHTSLVTWAGVALAAALICAPSVRWLDHQTGWEIFGYSPDGARSVLGVLVGAMLTFIVFVLSAMLIVVQLASGQLTPRVIALVLSAPWVRLTISSLTFTYTFSLATLGRVEDRVPELGVGIAVLLNLACILVFFEFVQRLSGGLRPASLMLLVAHIGRQVIEQVYPATYDPARPELATSAPKPTPGATVIPHVGRSGVVMAFSVEQLFLRARNAGAILEVVPQVGDSIARGDALFRVVDGTRPIDPNALRGCVAVGTERTLDQDPRFIFRILVDIANKALSPAINDPTTAVLALDQIGSLLLNLGRRRLDEGRTSDGDGNLRLVYGTPDWPDYVMLAVSEIRQYGTGSLQVNRRLRAMLEELIRELPGDRRPPLEAELALLGSAVKRGFEDAVDRQRAGVADYQGVGGSES